MEGQLNTVRLFEPGACSLPGIAGVVLFGALVGMRSGRRELFVGGVVLSVVGVGARRAASSFALRGFLVGGAAPDVLEEELELAPTLDPPPGFAALFWVFLDFRS